MIDNFSNPSIGNLPFFYSISDVRESLKEKTIKQHDSGAYLNSYLAGSPTQLYQELWSLSRAINIIHDAFAIPGKTQQDWLRLKNSVINADIEAEGRYAAFYAWTVISEEDRWDKLKTGNNVLDSLITKESDKFQNLNYGLITSCYTPIYRAAQYLSGWSTLEEDMDLPLEMQRRIDGYVRPTVYENFKRMTKAQIDKELDQLCLFVKSEDYYS